MRVDTKSSLYQYPHKPKTHVSFGARNAYKNAPKLTLTKATNRCPEIKKLKNIRAGEFSTICDGSLPMKKFFQHLKQIKPKDIVEKGISTNTDGYAPCFLKSSADNPLSTSYVHDCSVMYLYNKKTNTHTLYHTLWNVPKANFKFIINNFMPEGVTHAAIAAGNWKWVERHRITLPELFDAIKETHKDTIINIYHASSPCPEIVGYQGKLYEIPNKAMREQLRYTKFTTDYGQASFNISDIREYDTLHKIKEYKFSRNDLLALNDKFNKQNYDIEIKKVISTIIDNQLEVLEYVDKVKSTIGLFNLKISKGFQAVKQFCKTVHDNIAKHFI